MNFILFQVKFHVSIYGPLQKTNKNELFLCLQPPVTPNQTEGGPNGPPSVGKSQFLQEPNLRWTSDQSVNSSLSVVVQKKKTERSIFLVLMVAPFFKKQNLDF